MFIGGGKYVVCKFNDRCILLCGWYKVCTSYSQKSFADYCERFTLITFAIGFIIGLIWQSYLGNTWTTILCCTGAYLTYVTLVFTWPAKPSVQNMEVIEHD